jgi:hypothetical protein
MNIEVCSLKILNWFIMYIEVVSLCINIELSTFCAFKWFNMYTGMGSLVYIELFHYVH